MSTTNPIADLKRLGQSVWLDQIDREMIQSGRLARYRDAGVGGVTANPTIFARALESSDAYAEDVIRRLDRGQDPESIVWDLLIEDVQAAADVMRPVFDREHGGDGFVSIEVSPEIAADTDRTIAAARDLQRRTARPNVMVKIPATPAGLPAIQAMTAEGANINVTLIFAVERYVKVVEAYLAGLEEFLRKGGDLGRLRRPWARGAHAPERRGRRSTLARPPGGERDRPGRDHPGAGGRRSGGVCEIVPRVDRAPQQSQEPALDLVPWSKSR